MEEHQPTGELKRLLEQFRNSGGVVDYVLIESEFDIEIEQLHSIAVWFGAMVIRSRRDQVAAGEAFFDSEFFTGPTIAIDKSIPRVAKPETVSAFLREYHSAFSRPPAPVDDFSRPYRPVSAEIDTLFSQINTLIFGEFSTWSIRQWNTEWCSYFDARQQRWGAYLWTLIHENLRHGVWIGATPRD